MSRIEDKDQRLISVAFKHQTYWLFHSKSLKDDSFKNHAEHVWRIVKYETPSQNSLNNLSSYENHFKSRRQSNKINNYKIKEGDMIKFGRVRFIIKRLVIDTEDIIESAAAEEINDMSSFTKKTRFDTS
jgi:hypothetical protein